MSPRRHSTKNIFFYLFVLTSFFILVELSFLIRANEAYFGNFKLVANHLLIPIKVLPGILGFIAAQLLLHFCWIMFVFFCVMGVVKVLRLSERGEYISTIVIWFLSLFFILLSNQIFFPNSMFSNFYIYQHYFFILHVLFAFVLGISTVLILAAISGWLLFCQDKHLVCVLVIILSVSLVAGLFYFVRLPRKIIDAGTMERPNIILIGIDSLRPDYLGFYGAGLQTSHLDHFLDESIAFTDALTPLARTWPSWMAILTGQSPETTQARTNLLNPTLLTVKSILPQQLKQLGYQTIFATDESRFSNIDQSDGFDEIISPKMGFNDFLLGTLNDFPLSNLLVNSPIGHYLFPWSFANRAAFVTYNPNSFLKKISPVLQHSRTAPLFFAIHFCLPHYPYVWSSVSDGKKISVKDYRAAVERMDQQFENFMQLLKQNQLLTHSLVIVLSDHGEALELPGDRITDANFYVTPSKGKIIPRFYPPSADYETVNRSGGHGTDVLGFVQYHTVLGIRGYGLLDIRHHKVMTGRVSLLDIKPTILDYLKISNVHADGISLLPQLIGKVTTSLVPRDFYVESDFSPEAIHSVHPETRKVLFEGVKFFKIDPLSTRIQVRDSMLQMILSSKQYADYRGQWVLASYPQAAHQKIFVLVNLATGEWTTDLNTPFALHSPAQSMLQSLNSHFQ